MCEICKIDLELSEYGISLLMPHNGKTDTNGRFQIRVSEIHDIAKRQREINRIDLKDIDFLDENGNTIEVDKKTVDDFRMCGLNNTDFITSEFYLKGIEERITHV